MKRRLRRRVCHVTHVSEFLSGTRPKMSCGVAYRRKRKLGKENYVCLVSCLNHIALVRLIESLAVNKNRFLGIFVMV